LKSPDQCESPLNGASDNCTTGTYLVTAKDGADKLWKLGTQIGGNQDGSIPGQTGHWTSSRYAVLVEPGNYAMSSPFKLNYYTEIMGVDNDRANVVLSPGINALNECDVSDPNNIPEKCETLGALNNFWRSMSSMTYDVPFSNNNGQLRVAISQASPLRNLHIKNGTLVLCDWDTQLKNPGTQYAYKPCGNASGGFLSESVVDGHIIGGAQQQFNFFNVWAEVVQSDLWNTTIHNESGEFPPFIGEMEDSNQIVNPWLMAPLTQVSQDEAVNMKKPRLVKDNNQWKVKQGDSSDSLNDYVLLTMPEGQDVVTVSANDVATINQALSNGKKGLVVMPGIYQIQDKIQVPNNKTVLGIGIPSLVCDNPSGCMQTGSDGVRIAGVTFEAGSQNSKDDRNNVLLTVGEIGQGSVTNPTVLQDANCRIARVFENQDSPEVFACIEVNANNVIGQNLWLWRADHDYVTWENTHEVTTAYHHLVDWDKDYGQHGLIVNGDNVHMNGLFVEHFNNYQTVWNGKNGRINFYQSEIPYLTPQGNGDGVKGVTCNAPGESGKNYEACPSLYITENATGFKGQGMGIYSYFPGEYKVGLDDFGAPLKTQKPVRAEAAIRYDADDAEFKHVTLRWLDGHINSGINAITEHDGEYYSGNTSGVSGAQKGIAAGNGKS
ncbi:glycoside hydrolase family 55 protein, partial [Francisellaceae bacterium]|nr:glycoside hydrolase family 55 protein [Francisellaceae bacterium]